ncbi:M20/M25/M40 family metallo-hydrolase [Actinoplanes sp. N902-109]|uniref:M20/M25/M40 family metallo-hydrolase n=1 Tax=Actinoplanes sp. (strain N902-109) TaxID=649831 RepID=UPI000329508C|nr:M20/M25/M40 family metallo-hydrolase [Actinoplanes sp. N902-109]AGL14348.1 peptidase M28 [Actinoplanes sp. N902-109]
MATPSAAGRASAPPAHRGWAALAAVVILTTVGFLAVQAVLPPAAAPADAPAREFSAGRAYAQVETIAARPHVAGSAANDTVRDHLVSRLRSLGLDAQVQDTVSVQGSKLSASAGGVGLARVRNVVALWPGTASTGRIFVVAHYDSAQTGPGGNDDAAGVAAILEAARALTAGARLRNDVVFVLTDAEEACLCGAKAFVDQHPLAGQGGVVLNLEARGSSGPAIMFETAADNAGLIGAYAKVPHPVGTSFAVEIYRLLPNDTDFTAFRETGFTGLNSAYIDGAAVYHAPTDTPSAMHRDSLQHHGETLLALTRDLGDRDLPALRSDQDATYFPLPWGLARYPGVLTWPLAVPALALVLVLAWLTRRRGRTSTRRLLAATGLTLVPLVLVPVLAQALWLLLKIIRPGYAELPIDPYRPQWYRLAVLALTAAVVFGWYALLRRRLGAATLAVGALVWLAVLGVVLAAVAPGGSYLTVLPALAGAVTGIVVLSAERLANAARIVSGAVAVVVLLPTVVLFFPAMGMNLAAAGAFLAVLLALALLPVINLLHPEAGGQRGVTAPRARRLGALPTLAAVVATVAFVVTGLSVDRFDAAHPAPTHLMYALDTDTGQARWLSASSAASDWTARYVGDKAAPVTDLLPAFGDEKLLSGPARAAVLPAPLLQKTGEGVGAGGLRTVTMHLEGQRPDRLITLHTAKDARVTAATVGGRPVPTDQVAGGVWGFGFVFHAPPPDGIDVTLTLRAAGPLTIRVMDASDGLTGLPGFLPRPSGVGVVGSHSSEMVAVAKTYRL